MNLPCMKTPCGNCPFRQDTMQGWLGEKRITEILQATTFVCHKNTKMQCAGFMLMQKEESEFYRAATRMFPDSFKLQGQELIFKSKEDCVNHHKN